MDFRLEAYPITQVMDEDIFGSVESLFDVGTVVDSTEGLKDVWDKIKRDTIFIFDKLLELIRAIKKKLISLIFKTPKRVPLDERIFYPTPIFRIVSERTDIRIDELCTDCFNCISDYEEDFHSAIISHSIDDKHPYYWDTCKVGTMPKVYKLLNNLEKRISENPTKWENEISRTKKRFQERINEYNNQQWSSPEVEYTNRLRRYRAMSSLIAKSIADWTSHMTKSVTEIKQFISDKTKEYEAESSPEK